jgi:hypothetical protein
VVGVDTTNLTNTKATEWGLAYYCGFNRDEVFLGSPNLIQSPRVVNFNPASYLVVSIKELDTVSESGIYGSGEPRTAFAKIPFNINSFEFNFFDKLLADNVLNPAIAKLDKIHISFRYHDGTPVDFNGVEHSMTLELMCTNGRFA